MAHRDKIFPSYSTKYIRSRIPHDLPRNSEVGVRAWRSDFRGPMGVKYLEKVGQEMGTFERTLSREECA